MPPKKQESGGARAKAKGYKASVVLFTPEEAEIVRRAATESGMRAMTQFIIFHTLTAAKKILEKSSKSS